MRADKKTSLKSDKKAALRGHKRGVVGYSKKSALLEDAITQMNAGKYGRSSTALKELLTIDPHNMEARRLFATLHLRLGSLIPARQAFDSLIDEAFERQDYWLAESLLREYLAAGPRCVPYLERLGGIYQDKGNTLDAVTEYGKAVDIMIEDPDPENPHRASQLYAKIKDLAPASPITFRLAAFFDAQTGELVARPPAAQGETELTALHSSSVEDASAFAPTNLCPSTEMIPWEQVEDAPGTFPIPLAQEPGESSQSPVSPPATQETPEDSKPFRISEPVGVASTEGTSDPMPDVFPREASPSFVSSQNSIEDVPAVSCELDSNPIKSDDADAPLLQTPDSSHHPMQQESYAERVSTPTPWEEIQETSVSISPTDPDNPPAPSVQPEASIEPVAFVRDLVPATAPPNTLKEGVFSWNSLFTSPWKLSDTSPTSASMPEAGEEKTITTDETSGSASPSVSTPTSPEESIEIPEVDRAQSPSDVTPSERGVSPMPWDQVQESVITIPSVQGEETVAELSTEEDASAPSHVEPTLTFRQDPVSEPTDPQPMLSPVVSVQETDPISSAPSLTIAPSDEPDFHLAGKDSITPIEENQASGETVEQASSEFSLVSEPLKSVEPTVSSLPVSLSAPTVEIAPTEALSENISIEPKQDHVESTWNSQTIIPEPSAESDRIPSPPAGEAPPWKAGEMETKVGRSSPRKRNKTSDSVPAVSVSPLSRDEGLHLPGEQLEAQPSEFTRSYGHDPKPLPQQEEWVTTGESIRFIEDQKQSRAEVSEPRPSPVQTSVSRPISTAAAAVDVLFESSRRLTQTATGERITQAKPGPRFRSKLNRSRIAISLFISSCFSTTGAIVRTILALAVLTGALVTLGVGAVGLSWLIMEERRSSAFQSLTTSPQRMLPDLRKNGYLLLLGFDAPAGEDPIQVGYERRPDAKDADMALDCLADPGSEKSLGRSNASANVAAGWFRGTDPVGQFKAHQGTIKMRVSQSESMLDRYEQWRKLSFEDWGYGQTISPPCASILYAHRLYVAEGFIQEGDVGVDRLETDMEAWRVALGQAKTLPVKTLALQAINDDIAVASGLMVGANFDGKYLARLAKMLRPLDQVELSIRWPMQGELIAASKNFEAKLKAGREEEQSLHAAVAAMLPLPKQRRLNSYAAYYEASYKAAGEGRHGSLPKWKNYIQFPASTMMDYLTNPIENIVGLEPLAPWDLYNGLVVDTDAHLRLASLQAWLRHGPLDADLLPRIAKAGQGFYDPYTGLPMLVNLKKRVLYSVGHDGKDQDADPKLDVVVMIPANRTSATSTK